MSQPQTTPRAADQLADRATAVLDRIEADLDEGMTLRACPYLPALRSMSAVRARLLAGRLMSHAGAQRSGDSLLYRTARLNRNEPSAQLAALRALSYRRGPHAAWRAIRGLPDPPDEQRDVRAQWFSLKGFIWGQLRCFDRADRMYEAACREAPDEPWLHVERAYVCDMADRYEEGLERVQAVLRSRPAYRSAIQSAAHLLTLLGRDEEAFTLLEDRVARAESGSLAMQLFELQMEHGRYPAARETLERAISLYPLLDHDAKLEMTRVMAARRCDVLLRLDDAAAALPHAEAAGGPSYQPLADRLRVTRSVPRRVLLPVAFVRQHAMTCAPATLSALSRYWQRPAEHLEIAERICYDGTPWHSERHWAEASGFVVREFSVTWDAARALIDAGIPFTLTTTATASAHLQAVIGYDEAFRSLLIRDPFNRTQVEFDTEALLRTHRSTGPRGMAMMTADAAERVASLELPDETAWDSYHAVMSALARHDRAEAQAAAAALQARSPGHRLALWARRSLALYDQNEPALLSVTEELIERYPDDTMLRLSKASSLALTAPRARQLAWLRETIDAVAVPRAESAESTEQRVARARLPDPVAMIRYASVLSDDGRELDHASFWLRRAVAMAPTDAQAWVNIGHVLWRRQRRDEALEFYEIASCLSDTNEDLAATFFRASLSVGQTDSAIEFLRRRVARLGDRSGQPAMTLFQRLESIERPLDGLAVLEQAVVRRPEDAALALFLADAYWRLARLEDAQRQLERIPGPARQSDWLRLSARLARDGGRLDDAIVAGSRAADIEPFNLDNHRLMAALIAQQRGKAAAIDHLQALCKRFDHHAPLHELLQQWMMGSPPEERLPLLSHLVAVQDVNVWAWRELASVLIRLGRNEEALAAADRAQQIAPESTYSASTLAAVHLAGGRTEAGRDWLQRALTLSIDNEYAVERLMQTSPTLAQRKEALAFIRAQANAQVSVGESWITLQTVAANTLDEDELVSWLSDACDRRPDQWQTWCALAIQLVGMGLSDRALDVLAAAIARFPLLPRLYLEQARALVLRGDRKAARTSLDMALRISPFWSLAVRRYVETILDDGHDLERALPRLDAALARDSEDADLRGLRAHVYWRIGRRDEAAADMMRAVCIDPAPRWQWALLARYGHELGRPSLLNEAIDAVLARRPADAWAWLRAAEFGAATAEDSRIERALQLDPRLALAWEVRLDLLLKSGRLDEASEALERQPWGNSAPAGIRIFKARIARKRGDRGVASQLLEGMLAEDPNDVALWTERANWADEDELAADYRDAAAEMVRLTPTSALAHGWLGDAQLKCRQAEAARASFQQALTLDPAYAFAAQSLFDIDFEADRVEEARRIAREARNHVEHASMAARSVMASARLGDRADAVAAFRVVLRDAACGPWPADTAIRAMVKARWADVVLDEIEEAFCSGACADFACRHWLDHQGAGLVPGGFMRDVGRVIGRDAAGSLRMSLIERAVDKADALSLRKLLRRFDPQFRGDPLIWGRAGQAMLELGRCDDVRRWMHDWKRDDAPVWALDNLALALRMRARDRFGAEVSTVSLARDPANEDAIVWKTIDAVVQGRVEEAQSLLDSFPPQARARVRPYTQPFLAVAEAAAEAIRAGDAGVAVSRFREQRRGHSGNALLVRTCRRLGWRLVSHHCRAALRPVRLMQLCL